MFQDDTIETLAATFKCLGDPTRLRILISCLNQPRSVGDMAHDLQLSQALVSHHLRILKEARMVKGERQGQQIFYSADDEHVIQIVSDMQHHIEEQSS